MPQYPLILIKVEGEREERIAFYASTYEITVKEPNRVSKDVIRYEYSNNSRQTLMQMYRELGFVAAEEL